MSTFLPLLNFDAELSQSLGDIPTPDPFRPSQEPAGTPVTLTPSNVNSIVQELDSQGIGATTNVPNITNTITGSTNNALSLGSTVGTPPPTTTTTTGSGSPTGSLGDTAPSWLIRILAIVAGLILIAGAIFTLKPSQNIITSAARLAS